MEGDCESEKEGEGESDDVEARANVGRSGGDADRKGASVDAIANCHSSFSNNFFFATYDRGMFYLISPDPRRPIIVCSISIQKTQKKTLHRIAAAASTACTP